ncbi:phosphate ABC transporter substrate-binding protein [Rhodovulum sp. 12E13]|uniref:substrate-binding domain-containing protein n=1 Tax=Rhodovulum sp. 12E13 TaxID=2203891 RepID=UPI000E157D19|nr:substrate-binding domain-containing protein [Rhodovulum sp. 12E13]RDC71695.1 phosphate ABC transporter substrate-binding protein [Rhodovulum sp. 12E13]
MSLVKLSASALAITALCATAATARDEIRRVGSSTVFPYTQAVAEQFANNTGFPSPIVESTGTGGGMQIFCGGIGEQFADITGASRRMKPSEYQLCMDGGVTDITEARIGSDGLTIAVSRDNEFAWDMSLSEVYLALAAMVPVDGEWAENPYTTWNEINPDFPETEIEVLGPPPTSGTRDAFVELAMVAGCMDLDYVAQNHDEDWAEENCARMRTDGPFIEAGENDNLIVQRLQANSDAMGIFGYSFLFENQDTLKAVTIAGVEPTPDTIGDTYPISRPLYFYIKNAHRGVIPGFEEFLAEYMSEDALAPGGYLEERGLVPLSEERRAELRERVENGVAMEALN